MMERKKRKLIRVKTLKFISFFLGGSILIILYGFLEINIQNSKTLPLSIIQNRLSTTIGDVTKIVTTLTDKYNAPQLFTGDSSCGEDMLSEMKASVLKYIDIRSITITNGAEIACSTVDFISAKELYPIFPSNFNSEGFFLQRRGNHLTPTMPVIYYRHLFIPNSSIDMVIGLYADNLLLTLESINSLGPWSFGVNLGSQMLMTKDWDDSGEINVEHSYRNGLVEVVSNKKKNAFLLSVQQSIEKIALVTIIFLIVLFSRETVLKQAKKATIIWAIYKRHINPYIQGVYTGDGHIVGGEVLVRWNHPRKGLITPDKFIPFAEESELIITITRYLFERVRTYLQENINIIPPEFKISINISAKHLSYSHLISDCSKFISTFTDRPITLVLEITESQKITYTEEVTRNVEKLRSIGVKIALDDFGTGYASLSNLNHNFFDLLKIDRSFISSLPAGFDDDKQKLFHGIINLARSHSLKLVAEGVETHEQVVFLNELDVDFQQGWYWHRAVNCAQFTKLLIDSKTERV